MTNSIIITDKNASEHPGYSSFTWVTEASTLGIRAGEELPELLETNLGNGQPFVLESINPQKAVYRQQLGCHRLSVFND